MRRNLFSRLLRFVSRNADVAPDTSASAMYSYRNLRGDLPEVNPRQATATRSLQLSDNTPAAAHIQLCAR